MEHLQIQGQGLMGHLQSPTGSAGSGQEECQLF